MVKIGFGRCLRLMIGLVVIYLLAVAFTAAGSNNWQFLNTTAIGAKEFISNNPESDGRGVTIFILDSGVDPGVPGLLKTSTNETKIIDVQDFSGQGDVALYVGTKGTLDQERFIEHPDGFRLYNYHLLALQPYNDEYLIGYLDERRFRNSRIRDINNNGRSDDVFGVLVFEVEEADSFYWVAYVDTDGDQHIDDEQALRDYHVKFDRFQFRGGDLRYDRRMMTFAINVLPYEMLVSFHFDDDGHGTHVAGVAAGFEIHGQQGYHGIAPGAQIISLKIGSGIYEGGCTVSGSLHKAVRFIEDYWLRTQQPVVVNLSYGIGSILEGESDADGLINNLLMYNDGVFVCISNGNDGPGISTTGTPAAAPLALSVGAYLPFQQGNDILGTRLSEDVIFDFNARGGELAKPDVIAPGVAAST
ncbi:MAG: S8 family serine peptidase, partial [bacterium]|nr:S8 family serine peptidase [bacterium]